MKAGLLCLWVLALTSHTMHAKETIESRLAKYGATVDARLKPLFQSKGVLYPPAQLVLIGLKQEVVLYDPESFVAPISIVQNLDRLGEANEGDPFPIMECIPQSFAVKGHTSTT